MSCQKWWQQPGSPGPTGLVQGGFNSSKAVAWKAMAGLAHKLAVSLCFCRTCSEDGVFSAAYKGGVSPVFGLWEKEPAFANWRLQQGLSSGSWAMSASWDCWCGKLFSWWFHCYFPYGSWTFFLCSQGIPHSLPCLLLSCWAFTGHSIKNGFVVVAEQESESCWQAKQTMILQL